MSSRCSSSSRRYSRSLSCSRDKRSTFASLLITMIVLVSISPCYWRPLLIFPTGLGCPAATAPATACAATSSAAHAPLMQLSRHPCAVDPCMASCACAAATAPCPSKRFPPPHTSYSLLSLLLSNKQHIRHTWLTRATCTLPLGKGGGRVIKHMLQRQHTRTSHYPRSSSVEAGTKPLTGHQLCQILPQQSTAAVVLGQMGWSWAPLMISCTGPLRPKQPWEAKRRACIILLH
mmetsp:Transcript_10276/g.26791  ORF Transcript_10276/g.26791 Transcript_10276/m.26791 type:complete len:233 (-) Transcript_10276:798-1496(-)